MISDSIDNSLNTRNSKVQKDRLILQEPVVGINSLVGNNLSKPNVDGPSKFNLERKVAGHIIGDMGKVLMQKLNWV